ncbi:hypothetical protein P4V88_05805 [Bacillus thuringiensis]|uniref:hypothetical protein n=1 Tax=Bacillus thuringiensis TaxID=1428 RepID=UPI000A383BFB|nr:hypothetical protein [Bacillus thuringiensis]MED2125439.1 hypothetical protein [Bacillus thuringiensis]MED2146791.1 hypothetical protein [Bacillus thuringiensis]MED2171492.1 hypothetical protein [Bacillus thuringiensis]MED2476183.1 hypothetical protein [Bacillus thuringiensis]MED2573178.1 hypothetical protein [Bacillus thuringiensis]
MNKQLFIKDKPFNKQQFEPIRNWHSRPEGGLWTADYNEKYGSTWLASGNVLFEYDNPLGFVFNANPKANILILNTVKDTLEILPAYFISTIVPARTRLDGTEVCVGTYEIDFEKMTLNYDAIRVSNEVARADMQYNGKYSPLADWGIASTLWFNTSHLELVDKLSTEELKGLYMNAISY